MYIYGFIPVANVIYVFLLLWLCILIVSLCMATLPEVYPCFFLSCKANARVKHAKTGHGPQSSLFLCCCMYCLFCVVLCIVCVYMCTVLLPPGCYPIAVNPLNPELNPICYLLALLAHHFLHVSRIMVKSLPLRLLMSYIYIYIYIWSAYSWCF